MAIIKPNKKIAVCISLAAVIVLSFAAYFIISSNNKKIDNILLKKSHALIDEYPKVVSTYMLFQRHASIDMYEYMDTLSYADTLMFYYFCYDSDLSEKWKSVSKSAVGCLNESEVSSENFDEKVNILYYYSLITNRYKLTVQTEISDALLSIESYIANQTEADIYLLNNAWKLREAAKLLSLNAPSFDLNSIAANIKIEKDDLLSELSKQAIVSVINGKKSEMRQAIDNINIKFSSQEIDIESLIIYLNIFPKEYLLTLSDIPIEKIYDFCILNCYDIAPYTSFVGFMLCDSFNSDFAKQIQDIYKSRSINEEGFVSTAAKIIPTYRRLFQYSEVCHVLGINLDKATLYEVAESIDKEKLMVEDYYYMSLLARDYPDISIDKQQLQNVISKAETAEISYSNYFSYYYLVKAAIMNKVDSSNLITKMNDFIQKENEDYLIVDIWNSEIDFLVNRNNNDFEALEKRVLDYSGDLEIQTFYHYILYLKATNNKCSDAIKEKINAAINEHYVENGRSGGFWANSEFKYVDIANTYECLFLKDFFENN